MSVSGTRRKSPAPVPGSVSFVGAGPGDPELLTVRGAALLAAADVVVHDGGISAAVLALAGTATLVCVEPGASPAGRVKPAVDAARGGASVVRLLDGDAVLAGAVGDEVAACSKAKLAFEVVPGVPSATAVPSYAGIPLLGTRHGEVRILDVARGGLTAAAAAGSATLVLLHATEDLAGVTATLSAAGRSGDTPVAVTTAGTTPAQRTVVTTLANLARDAAGAAGGVVVVGPLVAQRDRLSWFETRPLFGWRVLVPRTKDQAGPLVARLRGHGAVPDEVPTISVEPPRAPQQVDRAVQGLVSGRYLWVAFTSVNAVRAITEKFAEYGLDARAFAGVKVAAVGEATAAALRATGVEPDLVPSGEQSSAGLLEDFPAFDHSLDPLNRVFLPRADIATETLAAGLVALGWEVDDVTAYRTVRAAPPQASVREAIKTGGFDAVVFTSSSTVRNLVGIAGKPHTATVIACIGPATAKTAEEHGLRVDVLAASPSADALADALAEFGTARRLAAQAAGETAWRPSLARPAARRRAR